MLSTPKPRRRRGSGEEEWILPKTERGNPANNGTGQATPSLSLSKQTTVSWRTRQSPRQRHMMGLHAAYGGAGTPYVESLQIQLLCTESWPGTQGERR